MDVDAELFPTGSGQPEQTDPGQSANQKGMPPADAAARLDDALHLLKIHHDSFFEAAEFAVKTEHPVPSDTRAWSQILVSTLTGIPGIARKKGADLADGSDVKAANVWLAIDTPRFNGVIKSGRVGEKGSLASLDNVPHLFMVLWDNEPETGAARCRVWVVRPQTDRRFREMCTEWYRQRDAGSIQSDNFQLHPPRNLNTNVIRNTCGILHYPLLFEAVWSGDKYSLRTYDLAVLEGGECSTVD